MRMLLLVLLSATVPLWTPVVRSDNVCKKHTTGVNCDQCVADTFYYSPNNTNGCISCFCAGVKQEQSCKSTELRRVTESIHKSDGTWMAIGIRTSDQHSPINHDEDLKQLTFKDNAVHFEKFVKTGTEVLYWSLPKDILGHKVTAYGGSLRYTISFNGEGSPTDDSDVIIVGHYRTLHYHAEGTFEYFLPNTVEFKLLEDEFRDEDGESISREELLMTLSHIKDMLIKASYLTEMTWTDLNDFTLEFANETGSGPTAYEVEQCVCPVGYNGTSCEQCSHGYHHVRSGLYLGRCQPCHCNGHSGTCNSEDGFCIGCRNHTTGDHCQHCEEGYVGNATGGQEDDCMPRSMCECYNHSPSGCHHSNFTCKECYHHTFGKNCEECKPGFFGNATEGKHDSCQQCPCAEPAVCHINNTANLGYFCRACDEREGSETTCDMCLDGYIRHPELSRQCIPEGTRSTTEASETTTVEPVIGPKDYSTPDFDNRHSGERFEYDEDPTTDAEDRRYIEGVSIKKHLKHYDKTQLPRKEGMEIGLMIRFTKMIFNEQRQTIQIDGFLRINWVDEHIYPKLLRNSTSERRNFVTTCEEIWCPYYALYSNSPFSIGNRNDGLVRSSNVQSYHIMCMVDQRGVYADPVFHQETPCRMEVHRYPYDKITCVVRFVNYDYTINEFVSYWNSVGFSGFTSLFQPDSWKSNEFRVTNITSSERWLRGDGTEVAKRPPDSEAPFTRQIMEIRIDLIREAPTFAYVAVLPLFVVSLLTTISLLHPIPSYGMLISVSTFPFYIICVHDFIGSLPQSSAAPPPIVVYYGICLSLSVLTLLYHVAVMISIGSSSSPTSTSILFENRSICSLFIGFLMFLGLLMTVF